MMGLKTRLALARTLVWVGLQRSPEVLAQLVRELAAGRADVVVLVQPGAGNDDLLLGHQAAVDASGGRVILGLAAGAKLARRARADLVAAHASKTPTRAHVHALTLAVARDGHELERVLADDEVDAVVVTAPLVAVAALLAPPAAADSKPWFAQAGSLAEGRSLIAAGARRLALESPPLAAETGQSPREVVAAFHDALLDAWRDEMEQVSFAALAADGPGGAAIRPHTFASALPDGSAPGRPAPDAPPAKAQPHEQGAAGRTSDPPGWSLGGHREKGPDDHW